MNSLPPEPIYEREIPTVPWEMLGSDILDYKRQKYLLVCDYFSKFPIIRKLESETSSCIIKYLSQIFSEQGIPKILFTDNGPCYDSAEFRKFSEKYGFRHTTSSPHFPQSNGLAERLVGIVKSTLKKCDMSKTDPTLAMLFLRTTPISHTLPSPAELLYNRQLKSVLPSVKHQLEHETTREKLKHRQEKQRYYYDEGTHELSNLKPGDSVMLQSANDLSWKPATVVSPTKEPRSYMVQNH